MAHLKNYRGATNYFTPSTDKYRDNYDRIFGSKDKPAEPETPVCGHTWQHIVKDGLPMSAVGTHGVCEKCGEVP
mgnify:CR=1 FL=1